MMIKLELPAIQQHLRLRGIEALYQEKTEQLYLMLKIGETEFPLFIRVFEGGELLQMLSFIPCNFKESTLKDTARLLHLLNKEMDIPGFGLDEAGTVVYYRVMLPAKDKQVDAAFFDAYLNAIDVVCKSFAPVITAVAQGAMTYADVLKQAQENISRLETENS